MITVGFLGYSPASVNVLLPLIKETLKNKDYNVITYSMSDFAITHFKQFNLDRPFGRDSLTEIDYFLYNTGSGNLLETSIPLLGRIYGFKSIHIMDIFWGDFANNKMRFPYNPDYAVCITNKNKHDTVKATNLPPHRVLSLGNPHFDRLKSYNEHVEVTGKTKRVSFISQCGVGSTYNEPTGDLPQKAILQLKQLLDEGSIAELKIYKHPRENTRFYEINDISFEGNNLFENMIDADVVISCGSTPHYEASILGLNTITFDENTDLVERMKNNEFDWIVRPCMDVDATDRIMIWLKDLISNDLRRKKSRILIQNVSE